MLTVLGLGLHEGERAVGEHRVIPVGREQFFWPGAWAGSSRRIRRTISRAVTACRVPANAV
jgi:hypothetical protein